MSKLVNLLVLGVSTKISVIGKILIFREENSTKNQDTENHLVYLLGILFI